jgi:hypothetical protein
VGFAAGHDDHRPFLQPVRLSGNDDFRLAVGDIDQGADGNLTVINIPPA